MQDSWISDRMQHIEVSGIRKVFELGRSLKDPVNLSIGQPHFDVPEPIRRAAHDAIESRKNGYTVTQGIAELQDKLKHYVARQYPGQERQVVTTSGTSGGLLLAMAVLVNPGDEVILFDPYFVSYPHLVRMFGGIPVIVDTYPDFQIDLNRLEAAITPKTKAIVFSSPANPTGVTLAPEVIRGMVEIAGKRGIAVVSDEIYRTFAYDGPHRSAAEFSPDVLVVDGFGKSYGMTGWRLGFAHGPARLIAEMTKLQQFTFVCAPSIVQYAGSAAWDYDTTAIVADYRAKRDRLCRALEGRFRFAVPGGAFYLYPEVPEGTATEFVARAIDNNLLVIPGNVFSRKDTHFRISFAASDEMLDRGIRILTEMTGG